MQLCPNFLVLTAYTLAKKVNSKNCQYHEQGHDTWGAHRAHALNGWPEVDAQVLRDQELNRAEIFLEAEGLCC